MKNIKLLSILFLQMALVTIAFGQETFNNGRPEGAVPSGQAIEENQPVSPTANEVVADHDFDYPRNIERGEPFVFPRDLELMMDELVNSDNRQALEANMAELSQRVNELQRKYEQLRAENTILERSLSNCCTASEMDLRAHDAYLLQNAPNPFNASTEINYFVPRGMENVQIELRDVNGAMLDTFKIDAAGEGKLQVDRLGLAPGSYVYFLTVDGQAIDSKVMIISQ
ncbi:MAG: T9SS type A sorting domain-containing protein [Lewinella sp.]|nr:T9SS type A sorting domain-containing protein [Lewinella sp.]